MMINDDGWGNDDCGHVVVMIKVIVIKIVAMVIMINVLNTFFTTDDLLGRMSRVKYGANFSTETRDDYLNTVAKQWLPYFERLAPVPANEKETFFVGDRITWVDYVIFDLLESHIEFANLKFEGKANQHTEILAEYPKLNVFFNKFANRPKLARYLKAERRMRFHRF